MSREGPKKPKAEVGQPMPEGMKKQKLDEKISGYADRFLGLNDAKGMDKYLQNNEKLKNYYELDTNKKPNERDVKEWFAAKVQERIQIRGRADEFRQYNEDRRRAVEGKEYKGQPEAKAGQRPGEAKEGKGPPERKVQNKMYELQGKANEEMKARFKKEGKGEKQEKPDRAPPPPPPPPRKRNK